MYTRTSSVGIAATYRLGGRGIELRLQAGDRDVCFLQSVQNGSGVHPAFYLMGIWGLFPRGKAAGA
jgi:hypothetical protein